MRLFNGAHPLAANSWATESSRRSRGENGNWKVPARRFAAFAAALRNHTEWPATFAAAFERSRTSDDFAELAKSIDAPKSDDGRLANEIVNEISVIQTCIANDDERGLESPLRRLTDNLLSGRFSDVSLSLSPEATASLEALIRRYGPLSGSIDG